LFSAFFLLSESELLPPELAPPESPLVLPTASVELPPPEEDSALLLLLLPSLPEVALVPESPDVESDDVALSEVADELVLLDVSVAEVVAVPEDDVPLVPHVVLLVVLLDVVLLVDVVDEIPEVDVAPPPVLVTITTPDEDVLDAEDLIPRYPERTSLRSLARFLAPVA